MGLDFDALVLGPCMALLGDEAIFQPVVSQPNADPYSIRGIFALKGADIINPDTGTLRADDYTFGVRASDFPVLPARGDIVSDIQNTTFLRFLEGRSFRIHDTGDDGQGGQSWVLKEVVPDDDP